MNSGLSVPLFAAAAVDVAWVFIELGVAILGLATLARIAHRFGFSAIPLYLISGLAFGNGGLIPLNFTEDFVHVGAEIGVILLLFMLGLEYSGAELRANLRTGVTAGIVDLLLNFPPGCIAGYLLGWSPLASLLLGGVTYISSSGIIARVLEELKRLSNQETPIVLSVLVFEDLAMAVFLPVVAVLLIGQGFVAGVVSVSIALVTVGVVLFVALRHGEAISGVVFHKSDEVVLLSTFGLVLVVAGIAQRLQVSAAVGAFLVGVALSGPIVKRVHHLIGPLRDLFAALFFLFFGLQIAPASLPPVLLQAVALGVVTGLTKVLTGWWAARRAGVDTLGSFRAGGALVARGEFSIVIADLGVAAGLEPQLGPLAAAYVLFLAVAGPVVARLMKDKKRGEMMPLYQDPWFTFRFNDDRIIPRFHLEGVEVGRQVKVFKIDARSGERLGLLATATVGEGGWVDLLEPIIVRAGEAFVAVPEQGSATPSLTLLEVGGMFAVCKLPPSSVIPAWVTAGDLFSVTRTDDELSVVCRQEAVPVGTQAEVGWRCLRVAGAMPFTLVGVLASLTGPVAAAGVGIFVVSTFDTDYLFVKEAEFQAAVAALRGAGHSVEGVLP